jgi:hypothetical protein
LSFSVRFVTTLRVSATTSTCVWLRSAEPAGAGTAPGDAKGVGLLAIGGLVVQFVLRPDVLHGLVSGVQSWVSRQRVRSVKLTLDGDSCEVTGASSAEQARMIDTWIARHASPR